jgi:predicted DNA-binding protein
MARKKILWTVYLEPRQDRDLRALSERLGKTMSAAVREAVDDYLAKHVHELPIEGDPDQMQMRYD